MYLLIIFCPILNILFLSLTHNFKRIFFSQQYFIKMIFISLSASLIFISIVVYEVLYLNSICFLECFTWFKIGVFEVKWSFLFDKLAVSILFLIIFISLLVHFFALDYLNGDPHLLRFLNLLSLFTIFMEILVTSGNLLQFFFGWEGVGLMSFLLINFWFTRYAAANAGVMAIIYNRIGDCGLLIAICILCCFMETTDFINIFLLLKLISFYQIKIFFWYFFIFDIITIFLFLGVIGKSAQIFLESWLASAMEGPTPVSSLLHASTMIVSGVFLLQRFQPLILGSLFGMICVTFVGGLTSFFAGTVGLVSMDLKRIIAYSTCSQMGYLVFCVGIGNTNISFFHLFNHAFFKCLLFVAAGTIIHAFFNNQDIRTMGGFLKLYPFMFILILIASLSLMGLPFFSGFYSKEKILEYSFYIFNFQNKFSFWFGSFSAFFTALYSARLLHYVFFNNANSNRLNYEVNSTKVVNFLNIVLVLLGLGSVFSGYLLEDLVIGSGTNWNFFTTQLPVITQFDIHTGNFFTNLLPFSYTLLGFFLSYFIILNILDFKKLIFYYYILFNPQLTKLSLVSLFIKRLNLFLGKRWFLNISYNRYLASLSFSLGYSTTFILLDKGFFELPTFISTRFFSSVNKLLSNNIYRQFYFSELLFYLIIMLVSFIFFNFSKIILIVIFFAVPKKKSKPRVRIKNFSFLTRTNLNFIILNKEGLGNNKIKVNPLPATTFNKK